MLGPTSHWVCFYCVGYTCWRALLLLQASVTPTPCFLIYSVCSAFVAYLPTRIVRVSASDIRHCIVYIPYFLQRVLPRATSRLRWKGQMCMKLSSSCCWCSRFIGTNTSDFKKTLNKFYVHVTVHRNKFLYNKTNRRNNFPNLFCQENLHVSGSCSAHHQESPTVHSALIFVMQFW